MYNLQKELINYLAICNFSEGFVKIQWMEMRKLRIQYFNTRKAKQSIFKVNIQTQKLLTLDIGYEDAVDAMLNTSGAINKRIK